MGDTIREQFLEIADRLTREGKPPVRVIFSPHGLLKARAENGDHNDYNDACPPPTYMGLPYTVRSDMAGEIGLDYKFEERRDAVTLQLSFDAKSGYMFADGNRLVGEPVQVMQIVGGQLTKAQLCDIIQGWVDAHPNEHLITNQLVDWVQTHGEFE